MTGPGRAVRFALLALLAGVLSGSSCSWSFHSGGDDDDDRKDDGGTIIIVEESTFGGWDLATVLSAQPGVLSVTSGWNGTLPFLGPEWTGWTGHARVVRVRFDAAQLPFTELVGAARAARAGSSRLTVYAHSADQRAAALGAFPADSLPRLRLLDARTFTPTR